MHFQKKKSFRRNCIINPPYNTIKTDYHAHRLYMPVARVGMYYTQLLYSYYIYEGCKYYDRENNLRFSLFYDLLSYSPNTYLTNQYRYNNIGK